MQAEELSYVIVTPYSMRKSRTGGILSRLISRTGLDLVGGRMFAPGEELVRRYTEEIVSAKDPRHRATQELIRDYVRKNFTGERDGQRPRVLLLIFRGPTRLRRSVTSSAISCMRRTSGETIRDTYGDYVTDEAGKVTYFEPGVLASLDAESVEENLKLWAEFSDRDGGILDDVITYPAEAKVEKSLVLIKPDNFKFPNIRPGGLSRFSRTGSASSASKCIDERSPGGRILRPGPHRPRRQARGKQGPRGVEDIVEFMSGRRPSATSDDQRLAPGTEKCIAIVYQGADAVRKIRDVLGPTDPSKAPPGSIRREFGQTIMINAAHASDSAENAKREMQIVQVSENNLKPLIENFYARP
jgi:nucleoside diphosphate kinase